MVVLRKRIGRGRLIAGIALHFLVPAYALALMADAALGRAPAGLAAWLPHALVLGGWFLLAYGGAAMVLAGLGALSDRGALTDRGAEAPHDPGGEDGRLAGALAAAQGRFGVEADRLLASLAEMRPDWGESQTREIARDIIRLLESALAAREAGGEALALRTTAALGSLTEAITRQCGEAARLARDEAHAMANYVEAKYGQKID